MACGLPVVTNDVGGARDYTTPDFADLFPVGDAEGMATATLRLVDDFEERQRRGALARLYTEQNFTWEKIAAKTLDIYHTVSNQ